MKSYINKVTVTVLFIVFILLAGWKIPIILKIETLKLPPGCEMVYPSKVWISDVYWPHIKGEKVIKCDLGYEAAKEYIETHNSKSKLSNISIDSYDGMSDLAIYNSEFDDYFEEQPDKDNYIKIDYFLKF